MRLLIFSPYFPPHIGGVEGYVRDLNEELTRLGLVDRITVLAPRIPLDGSPSEQIAPGYNVVRYPAFDSISNFPCPAPWQRGFAAAMRTALGPGGHDVIVCHTRFFLSSLAALIFSKATGLPLIHVEHGSDYVHLGSARSSAVARSYDLTLGRLVLRRADAVVAISQAAARFVDELAGRNAQVIYRGVDPARYGAVEPSAQLTEFAAGRPVVTFIGRLIDGKGVADLVESFAGLEDKQAMLCIVGDGPCRSQLERLCAVRGLSDRCWFVGYQSEDRALEFIRASDVTVNPSYTEGLPTSVLESALLGRAIIATDVGGTSEVVVDKRSALLVPPREVEVMRGGLAALLADPVLRARLGTKAREEATERFASGLAARQFIEVAHRLLDPYGDSLG